MTSNDQFQSFTAVDLSLDVSDAVATDGACSISGTLFVPDNVTDEPQVVVAVPGASYNRRYWDIRPPVGANYSQAAYFAHHGIIFVAMDYLGGGDSTRPAEGELLTLPIAAAAAHQAVSALIQGLRDGTFVNRKIKPHQLIGIGHSFGGAVTIVQQATFEDFDAIAVLGYSAIESAAVREVPSNWEDLTVEDRRAIVENGLAERFGGNFPIYHGIPRSGTWRGLYPEDITDDVVDYDDEMLHTTVPRTVGVDVMTPGFTLPYAARITVPVFLAFGDQDTCTRPHIQPSAYSRCPDLTLTTYTDMKHLHNFAASRESLWERSVSWLDYLKSGRTGKRR